MIFSTQDHLDVYERVVTYLKSLDDKDWAAHRAVYADRIVADFGEFSVDASNEVEADAMVAQTRELLDSIPVTQHIITNCLVAVDGDNATASFYEQAIHVNDALGEQNDTWTMYGRVHHRYIRSGQTWKLYHARLVQIHHTGNREVMNPR